MVQALDMVINIEENLEPLRLKLRSGTDSLFEKMFKIWMVDPISSISLCLMCQEFRLSLNIV